MTPLRQETVDEFLQTFEKLESMDPDAAKVVLEVLEAVVKLARIEAQAQ